MCDIEVSYLHRVNSIGNVSGLLYTGMNSDCNVALDKEDKHGSALFYFTSIPQDNHPNCR